MLLCLFILFLAAALAYALATGNGTTRLPDKRKEELNNHVFGDIYNTRDRGLYKLTAGLGLEDRRYHSYQSYGSNIPILFSGIGKQLRRALRSIAETESRISAHLTVSLVRMMPNNEVKEVAEISVLMQMRFPCVRVMWATLKTEPSAWKDSSDWEALGKRAFPRSVQLSKLPGTNTALEEVCVPYGVARVLFPEDWQDATWGWMTCAKDSALLIPRAGNDALPDVYPAPTWEDLMCRELENALLPICKHYTRDMA